MATDHVPKWIFAPLPFAKLLGIELVTITPERVEAVMSVREELCTRPAVLHGGAVMALADTLGAIATLANVAEGVTTATIESKTNFFAPIPVGDTVRAECTPLHRGRSTMVWQTKVIRSDGRVAALVIQTQLVLPAPRESDASLG
jgi:1,4-dihydroxy-2-naphthoyl-CoA hydrolase